MRSDKQNQASRQNGAKSTGPTTPEGKANSSQNARRHNLCAGQVALLSNEDEAEFGHIRDEYFLRFLPVDSVEMDIVHKLIAATWRERRVTAMESALFEIEMLRQKPDVDQQYLDPPPEARQVLTLFGNQDVRATAALLFRYGSAARRAYSAAMRDLRELQGDRFYRQPALGPAPILANQEDDQPKPNPESLCSMPESPDAAEPASALARTPLAARSSVFLVLRRRRECMTSRSLQKTRLPNEPERAFSVGAGAPNPGLALIHP